MLPKPLSDMLVTWAASDIGMPNSLKYKHVVNPSLEGEFLVIVKREIKLVYPGITSTVTHQKIFPTSVVSARATDGVNLKADEYRLKRFLEIFDEEFVSKVIDAESKAFEQFNPDGFF